jgi:hypothetical protein
MYRGEQAKKWIEKVNRVETGIPPPARLVLPYYCSLR